MQHKHTPGPWEIYEGATPSIVAGEVGNAQIIANRLTEANAARIVACVNALEGIEDPEEWMRKAQEDKMRLKLYEFTFGILQEMQDAKNQDETKP